MSSKSLRLNESQTAALSALRSARRPLSAYEVLDAVRAVRPTAAPPTAYRALDKLVAAKLVHRLESINAYVACAHHHDDDVTPLFAICDACGAVAEMADGLLSHALRSRAAQDGFVHHQTVVEMRGTCALCINEAA